LENDDVYTARDRARRLVMSNHPVFNAASVLAVK
jgi:hypothetical protein